MKKFTFASLFASTRADSRFEQTRSARWIAILIAVCVAAATMAVVSSPAHAIDTGTVYESTVLADGPVAYWKFDEITGAFVDEVAGLELQESVGGSVVRDLPSLVPSADDRSIKLVNSASGPVSESITPGPGTILADEFTLEFWIDHDDVENYFPRLRSMGAAGTGWTFHTQNDLFRFVVQTTDPVVTQLWFPKASGHYVLTMDANYMKVFKDGANSNRGPRPALPCTASGLAPTITSKSPDKVLGSTISRSMTGLCLLLKRTSMLSPVGTRVASMPSSGRWLPPS